MPELIVILIIILIISGQENCLKLGAG